MTITPDTIITAELLAGLDKCPFCGAKEMQDGEDYKSFECSTYLKVDEMAGIERGFFCLTKDNTTLRARVKELQETIQKLHKGAFEQQDHIAELENRLRAKFNKSEEDSKHYQERIQRLVEAGDDCAEYSTTRAQENWTKAKEGL